MPEMNPDNLRRYTYTDYEFRNFLDVMLQMRGVTPDSHPTLVDLAAGDGSMSAIFAERGWREKNMLCVDRYESPSPLVNNATWYYLDLLDLASDIEQGKRLPREVEKMKGAFDIVTIMQVPFRRYDEETLWNYFAKGKNSLIVSQYKLSKLSS